MDKSYPLLLERRLDDRIWGGRRLAPFLGLPEPHPERIAESWQVYDENKVLNGPMAGRMLGELCREQGERLLGTLSLPRYGVDLPLLAKFIDAQQDLSIQVHPDDAYAHRVEATSGYHGKSEAWVVLDAAPRTELFYHLKRPVSRAAFRQAVEGGGLLELLNRRPVQAGDVIHVPAGTLHTISAGVLLFEIQQKSDLTYRVYDHGRGRPLHLEKALDVIAFDRPPPARVVPLPLCQTGERMLLIATPHFAVERLEVDEPVELETRRTSLEIHTLIDGRGELNWEGGAAALRRGTSVVLPAGLGAYRLAPEPSLTLLRCWVPDLEGEVVPLLRGRGFNRSQIGGVVRGA